MAFAPLAGGCSSTACDETVGISALSAAQLKVTRACGTATDCNLDQAARADISFAARSSREPCFSSQGVAVRFNDHTDLSIVAARRPVDTLGSVPAAAKSACACGAPTISVPSAAWRPAQQQTLQLEQQGARSLSASWPALARSLRLSLPSGAGAAVPLAAELAVNAEPAVDNPTIEIVLDPDRSDGQVVPLTILRTREPVFRLPSVVDREPGRYPARLTWTDSVDCPDRGFCALLSLSFDLEVEVPAP